MIRIFPLICAAALSAIVPAAFGAKPPNIVFVLFDDMAWGQPQSYRPESALRTPRLDQLAREGMRFTDAHSASAVCTPTRYGVLTGRYPSRIGQFGVCTTYSKPIIPESRTTVASLLKAEGYATACIGKWHLGLDWVDGKPGTQKKLPEGARFTGGPMSLGFDFFYGFTHARNIFSILEQDRVVDHVKDIENQPLMIAKAVDWIGQQAGSEDPFFLYFPMCPPHTPVVPSPEYLGKSGGDDLVKKDPKYADWVYQGDAMLGQILDALDANGMADDTLVIATADNGAEGRPYSPLRASKRSIYEGGHRVPFVARWPGTITAGSTSEATVCLNDLMATAAELTGATIPENAGEDSFSLVPAFNGQPPARPHTVHQSMPGDLALRQGPWKLVALKNGSRELYHLGDDLGETSDRAGDEPSQMNSLVSVLQSIIDQGRSTPGTPQTNEFPLQIDPPPGGRAKMKNQNPKNS